MHAESAQCLPAYWPSWNEHCDQILLRRKTDGLQWPTVSVRTFSRYILLLCLRLVIKFYKDLSLCFNFGWQVSFRWFAGCPSSVLQGRVSTFTGDGNETVRKPLKHLETEVKSLTANFSTCFMQQLWCAQERTSTCVFDLPKIRCRTSVYRYWFAQNTLLASFSTRTCFAPCTKALNKWVWDKNKSTILWFYEYQKLSLNV